MCRQVPWIPPSVWGEEVLWSCQATSDADDCSYCPLLLLDDPPDRCPSPAGAERGEHAGRTQQRHPTSFLYSWEVISKQSRSTLNGLRPGLFITVQELHSTPSVLLRAEGWQITSNKIITAFRKQQWNNRITHANGLSTQLSSSFWYFILVCFLLLSHIFALWFIKKMKVYLLETRDWIKQRHALWPRSSPFAQEVIDLLQSHLEIFPNHNNSKTI